MLDPAGLGVIIQIVDIGDILEVGRVTMPGLPVEDRFTSISDTNLALLLCPSA